MRGFAKKAQREARFYPSTPTLEQAIEKLDVAQDLLLDVAMLMGNNWQHDRKSSLQVMADDLGSILVKMKMLRERERWRK